MAARRPFWKWHCWKSIGSCLWPPSTCIWNLKLKFQSKLDLCSGNHVIYRQTDGRTDGRMEWNQYTPQQLLCSGGIKTLELINNRLCSEALLDHSICVGVVIQAIQCLKVNKGDGMKGTVSDLFIHNWLRMNTIYINGTRMKDIIA